MTSTCLLIAQTPRTQSYLHDHALSAGLFTRHITAAGIEEGMRLLDREAVDLILYAMEEDGGAKHRNLRRLCRRAKEKEVPVVACGTKGHRDGIAALEAGSAEALSARVSSREFILRLRRLLEVRARLEHLRRDRDELSRQALTDGLTGLGNRRFFQQRLCAEAARSSRNAEPFALVLMDLDHFKKVNDTFGHPTGDQVLRAIAEVLCKGLRRSDVACRIGGEEFALILPGTGAGNAAILADKLRRRISSACRTVLPPDWSVTVSIGINCGAGPGTIDVEALVTEADKALYSAKETGRNRTICAPSSLFHHDLAAGPSRERGVALAAYM